MKRTTPIEHAPYTDPVQWPLPPLFSALRTHAHRERLIVVGLYMTEAAVPCFIFSTENCREGNDPLIAVKTPERVCNIPPDGDVEHTIALGHELGHHESWLLEEASAEFQQLMMNDPTAIYDRTNTLLPELLDEMVAEEKRAWTHGREILARAVREFTAWEEYDRIAGEKVMGYERAAAKAKREQQR